MMFFNQYVDFIMLLIMIKFNHIIIIEFSFSFVFIMKIIYMFISLMMKVWDCLMRKFIFVILIDLMILMNGVFLFILAFLYLRIRKT